MSVFDSINETSNNAIDAGERYLKSSHEYYRLKIFQQLSVSLSLVFKTVIIAGLTVVGLTFVAIALAFFIGSMVDNYALGFVIVGALFFILAVLCFLFRKHINNLVVSNLSDKFFE
ncbi:phage holin family protein [Bizionia paragorgiae]|uniref:phage holin family protein n=1 Tax=Bizionia paragorgiae TaxID=283786 RepID=UPI00299E8684|nr:phage holin family protein [Bizionia paragorgiae]MDX1270586.1 phage holin family protein [Bizionia paragorgiae]